MFIYYRRDQAAGVKEKMSKMEPGELAMSLINNTEYIPDLCTSQLLKRIKEQSPETIESCMYIVNC